MRWRLTTIAVAALAFVIALHPIVSEDLFWHLAAGRWILEHRAVPRTDVLTYTLTDRPWTNLQWGGDVFVTALWRWAGADGVVLVKALAFAALGWLLLATGRAAGGGRTAAAAAAIVAILASAERTFERPEIASYLCLAATLFLSTRHLESRSRWFVGLPLLHAAWANLHALAFLGPLTLALFAVRAALDGSAHRPGSAPSTVPGSWRSFALVAGISALSLLANPYGIGAWTFPATLLQRIGGQERVFSRILEFASPLDTPSDPAMRWFWLQALFLIAAFVFAFVRRGEREGHAGGRVTRSLLGIALLIAPYFALALLARRNVPLFAIVCVGPLARLGGDVAASIAPRVRRILEWVPIGLAVVLTAAILGGASPKLLGLWRDRGLGVQPGLFPDGALGALDREGIRGRIFNDLDYGGYISWRNPERMTFIDGRLEVCGPERLENYLEAHVNPEVWSRVEASWNFDALLLRHVEIGNAAFLRERMRDGRWVLARLDPEAALLLRADRASAPHETAPSAAVAPNAAAFDSVLAAERGPEPHAGGALEWVAAPLDRWARRLRVDPPIAPVRSAVRWANACITAGWVDAARTGYDRVLEVSPNDPEALLNRGLCDVLLGDPEAARDRWTRAITLVDRLDRPRFEEALAHLPPRGAE